MDKEANWYATRGLLKPNARIRIPKDKPPLLSDEEILKISLQHIESGDYWDYTLAVKAQREADIKWYEG